MSGHDVRKIVITPMEVRDFSFSYINTGNKIIDLLAEFGVVGLDFLIVNNGAAGLTIAWDNHGAVTVGAGDNFGMSNIKFSSIKVVSAVDYDLVVAGVFKVPVVRK